MKRFSKKSPSLIPVASAGHRHDFLWKKIARLDFYIGTTITRASALAAINAFVAGSIVLKWTDILTLYGLHSNLRFASGCLIAGAAIASSLSMFFSFRALIPYLRGGSKSVVFFGDVALYSSAREYADAVSGLSDAALEKDLSNQAYLVSKGLAGKFRLVRLAFLMTAYGTLPLSMGPVMLLFVALMFDFFRSHL